MSVDLDEARKAITELTIERLGLLKRIADHDRAVALLNAIVNDRNEQSRYHFERAYKLETELTITKNEVKRLNAELINCVGIFKGIASQTDYCHLCDRHPSSGGHHQSCLATVSYYDKDGKLL